MVFLYDLKTNTFKGYAGNATGSTEAECQANCQAKCPSTVSCQTCDPIPVSQTPSPLSSLIDLHTVPQFLRYHNLMYHYSKPQ
jgi:hypothetical protein